MRFSRSAKLALAALALTTLNGCVAALIPIASSIAVANRGKADKDPPEATPTAEPSVIVEAAATPAPAPAPALAPAAPTPAAAATAASAWPVQAATTATASAAPQPSPADAPMPVPQGRMQVPRIDVAHMQDMVRTIASDDFAGRAPSTNEEAFVLDYIVRQFEAAGLKPGNKGTWLQAVQTTEITGSGYTQLAVNGGVQPVVYEFGSEYVAVSPSGPPRSELKDAPLVFVGFGVVAPELGWNDYAGLDIKGKVAVVLVNDPDYAAEAGPFGGRRMTYYGRWTYKLEEAARQGAAGVLLVHEDYPAGYGWNVVRSGWTGPQNYIDNLGAPAKPTVVQGWIQLAAAKEIFKAARKDFDVLAKSAREPGFRPVELGVTANLGFVNAIRKAKSYNVIGVLPGAGRADEYVLYTAHWDHLGRCEPEAKDRICNGAVDNATGVAAIAEIAAMNNRAGPTPRSQVFIATTLEEAGLLGSEHYAQNPVFPLGRTVAGINLDSLRPGGWTRDVVQTGGDKSDLTAYLAAATREMRLTVSLEPNPERGSYYRSDHFSFAKRGVPMLSLARGLDLTRGGAAAGKAAADDYQTNRYHGPADEYGPDWEWSGIMQDVELAYRLGRLLAESSAWPNWHPGDEFRAERDKSAAERSR